MQFNNILTQSLLILSLITLCVTESVAKDANILAYKDRGIKYYPRYVKKGLVKIGKASWYGKPFHGKLTANGERYNMYAMTAAHRTYAMNTLLKVTNLKNKKSVKVRVNDRGPFYSSRNIDLSYGAARKLGITKQGVGRVRIEVLNHTHKPSTYKVASRKRTAIKKSSRKQLKVVHKKKSKTVTRDNLVQIASFFDPKSAKKFKNQQKYKNMTIIKRYLKSKKKTAYKVVIKCTPWEAKKLISSKKFSGAYLLS